jgi:hypothetical protein
MTKPSQSDNANWPLRDRGINTGRAEAVTALDPGLYRVISASAAEYILNIGPLSSSLARFPHCQIMGEREAVPLRRDGESMPLLEIIQLQIGRPAVFRIDVRGDGVETIRTTTPVCAIRRLTE